MTTMEALCICAMQLLSFIVGARVGMKASKGEKIVLNPVEAISNAKAEHKEKKEKQAEDEYIKTIMYNIDHYTGDGIGQKEIPNRK